MTSGPPGHRRALAAASWRERLRFAGWLVLPTGVHYVRAMRRRRAQLALEQTVAREIPASGERVEQAIGVLLGRGLEEDAVRQGSMSAEAFAYVAETVSSRLPPDRPVRVLHVGNFVGVSLCCFGWLVAEHHPESVVVSVDPNLPHRGVDDPQAHVLALLEHFGLLERNLVVTGYSVEVLAGLERLGGEFDLVLLDGDHGEEYLARELEAAGRLLAPRGLIALDDVIEGRWDGVVAAFDAAAEGEALEEIGRNGRVGILQARATAVRG